MCLLVYEVVCSVDQYIRWSYTRRVGIFHSYCCTLILLHTLLPVCTRSTNTKHNLSNNLASTTNMYIIEDQIRKFLKVIFLHTSDNCFVLVNTYLNNVFIRVWLLIASQTHILFLKIGINFSME